MPDRLRVHVEDRQLELSNLDKVLYPAAGFTKGEVVDYYTRIAPVLLPHLRDRPLTWIRVETLPAPGSRMDRETIDYVVCDDLPTLVWLANLAALELHVPQWKVGSAGPDRLVVDLDPGPPAGLAECAKVALLLRERLAADGLTAYPKTSGRKGMQLMCALAGEQSAEDVSTYARVVAEELAGRNPRLITARMTKSLRPGKVFIDWSQNSAAKTTVAPYSLRAEPTPTASAPLTWDEVESGKVRPLQSKQVLARAGRHGDLLAALCDGGPRVPA